MPARLTLIQIAVSSGKVQRRLFFIRMEIRFFFRFGFSRALDPRPMRGTLANRSTPPRIPARRTTSNISKFGF